MVREAKVSASGHDVPTRGIADLDLSPAAVEVLADAGVRDFEDLLSLSARQYLRIAARDRSALREVVLALGGLESPEFTEDDAWWRLAALDDPTPPIPEPRSEVSDRAHGATVRHEALLAARALLADAPRRAAVLIAYRGWDGSDPLTLRRIGERGPRFGFARPVSRQRIGRVAADAERRLRRRAGDARLRRWRPTVRTVSEDLPMSETAFATAFGFGGYAPLGGGFRALAFVADVFGLEFPFALLPTRDGAMVVDPRQRDRLGDAYEALQRIALGRPFIDFTAESARRSWPEAALRTLIRRDKGLRFLDRAEQYVWRAPPLPPPNLNRTGDRILTLLCKVISVAERADASALASTISRDAALRAELTGRKAPPSVVAGIAAESGLFRVDGETISPLGALRGVRIGAMDRSILIVASRRGHRISGRALHAELRRLGASRNAANLAISTSPFVLPLVGSRGARSGSYEILAGHRRDGRSGSTSGPPPSLFE